MDYSNYQTGNLPLGLSMALAMNDQVKAGYEGLSETEKEHLILKCKDAKSKEEMDRIIDSVSSEGNAVFDEGVAELFRGPNIG